MTLPFPNPPPARYPAAPRTRDPQRAPWRARAGLSVLVVLFVLLLLWLWRPWLLLPGTQPLVMEGGDPYLRALMRTISASEANVMRPYHVLYGGDSVGTLERHPNRCQPIPVGPNKGSCSTAAGRYQLLYGTWLELAARHHPERTDDPLDATGLSFAPVYQDMVVMAWLQEGRWGNLSAQLRAGRIQPVLRRLSGTWTSLGHGIENNSMSRELPRVYRRLVEEELQACGEVIGMASRKCTDRPRKLNADAGLRAIRGFQVGVAALAVNGPRGPKIGPTGVFMGLTEPTPGRAGKTALAVHSPYDSARARRVCRCPSQGQGVAGWVPSGASNSEVRHIAHLFSRSGGFSKRGADLRASGELPSSASKFVNSEVGSWSIYSGVRR